LEELREFLLQNERDNSILESYGSLVFLVTKREGQGPSRTPPLAGLAKGNGKKQRIKKGGQNANGEAQGLRT